MTRFSSFRLFLSPEGDAGAGGAPPAPVPPVTTPPAGHVDDTTPKYSDKQVNDMLAAKVGKEASKEVAKILEAAGIKDTAELAELAKGKKTPAADDPAKKELEELKKSTSELTQRADRNEAEAQALKAGVKPEALERVVKLAMSPAYEGTISERINKIVAEVPEFKGTGTGAAFGVPPKDDKQDATESVLNQARRAAGLAVPTK